MEFLNEIKKMFGGKAKGIPKLVVCINQVDNLGSWDDSINLPTEETEENIRKRVDDIIKKLSAGSHTVAKDQIEYYSALRAYRLPFVISKIAECSDVICRFSPVRINDPRVSPSMSDENRKEIQEMIDESEKGCENLDYYVEQIAQRLPEDKANEFRRAYQEKSRQPIKVAVLGQSGVGKTTTVNNLFGADFKVSRTIVGTSDAQYKDFELKDGGTITIVDLPGYGRSVSEDEKYKEIYLQELKGCDVILLIIQANEKGLVDDQQMIEHLYEWTKDGLI